MDKTILWSTVKVDGMPLDDYLKLKGKTFNKDEHADYVKSVSKLIVDNIGGTEFGPAAAFRDIVRAIVRNTNEILPVATPMKFDGLPEPVFVSVPLKLGTTVGCSIYSALSSQEKNEVADAAEAIYQTYKATIEAIEKSSN